MVHAVVVAVIDVISFRCPPSITMSPEWTGW